MPLIDRYIASPHFSERHALRIRASAEAVLEAAAAYRTECDPFFRRMIGLRELPMRFSGLMTRRHREAPPPFGIDNFTLLEQGNDEIVYGLAGRFWRSDFDLVHLNNGLDFLTSNKPGIAKLALNFAVFAESERMTILSTETRILCVDVRARVAFAPYWYLIRPVSGLIRRRILNFIRKAAETPESMLAA